MVVPTISNTIGAIEIGSVLTTLLFGILTLQVHTYFVRYQKDRIILKALVGAIWVLDLGHTVTIAIQVYRSTITHYGAPPGTFMRFPELGVVNLFGAFITTFVQLFFAYRVWTVLVSPYRYVGAVCAVTTTCRLAVGIWFGIKGILAESIQDFATSSEAMGSALLGMGAGVDLIIAGSMLWYFMTKRDGAFPLVVRLIDRLVAWNIRTGAMTSVGSILVIILYKTMGNTMVWVAAYFCVAKFYSISLLSALNGRQQLREAMSRSNGSSGLENGPPGSGPGGAQRMKRLPKRQGPAVTISRTVHVSRLPPLSNSDVGGDHDHDHLSGDKEGQLEDKPGSIATTTSGVDERWK